jgi:hypothetical protein
MSPLPSVPERSVARSCLGHVRRRRRIWSASEYALTVNSLAGVSLASLIVAAVGCGGSKASGSTQGDAMSETVPNVICRAGCLCSDTAESCPSGCFRSFSHYADGGIGFAGCYDVPIPDTGDSGGAASCTYRDGGGPGSPNDFGKGCPGAGCPSGTVCVTEGGGIAGGGGQYCASIPIECDGTPSCACMGVCACTSGVGYQPEICAYEDGSIGCDNGVR